MVFIGCVLSSITPNTEFMFLSFSLLAGKHIKLSSIDTHIRSKFKIPLWRTIHDLASIDRHNVGP